jgi:hypothetical protein
VEITDEMKVCFAEETSELTQEDFDQTSSGEPSDDVALVIGNALLACGIPVAE